jgi:hypothetical protein
VLTRTHGCTRCKIRCLGGVSIPSWLITPTLRPYPWSWMRSYPLSKSMCQVRSNYWYEKCQTTYCSMEVCNYQLDHCNGHRTCETLTSNSNENSNNLQFPFNFFALVAHIEMKFGIQIYHTNIYVKFSFEYDRAIFDTVIPIGLQKIP